MHAPAAAVRAVLERWGTVEDIDDQSCRLRIASDTFDWPAMALGAVGADFDIVSPPEFVDYIADWGHRFTHAAAAFQRHAPSGSYTRIRPRSRVV